MVTHSLRVGKELSKTEGEPTTHWLPMQFPIELEIVKSDKGKEGKEE